MKKIARAALALCLTMFLGWAALSAAGEANEWAVGQEICGFRVVSVRPMALFHAEAWHLEHEKSGAQLLYFACEDTNRAFSIAFNTPTWDDKGIPHVFEHSALSGSEKYPDPNLFFSMAYGTYSSYMNASTYKDMTIFNTSSLSEEQLLANMDVYMAGVMEPLILTDERAMMREAYRYELPQADEEITLTGTVYSEMLGAMDLDRTADLNADRLVFPGSYAASLSGGLPEAIPDMTHEELVRFHEKWYTPANALIVLYGDLDAGRFLRDLDENWLSRCERREVDLTDPGYRRLTGDVSQRYEFPVSADAPVESRLIYDFPIAAKLSAREAAILGIGLDLLNMEDRTLDSMMREQLPGGTATVSLSLLSPDPVVRFTASGISAEEAPIFRRIVDAAIGKILDDGFDPEDVDSQVYSMRYANAQMAEESYAISMTAMASYYWAFARDPEAVLDYYEPYGELEACEKAGAFDEVFRKAFANVPGRAFSVTTTLPGGQEELDEARATALREMKENMTGEQVQALVERTRDYETWAAENAKRSLLSQTVAVDVQDLPEEVLCAQAEESSAEGVRVITSEVAGSDYLHVSLYLDASAIPVQRLGRYELLSSLLGDMPTARRNRTALANARARLADELRFSATTLRDEETGKWRPVFVVSFNTFEDLAEESFSLIREILFETALEDPAYVRSYAASTARQTRISMQASPASLAVNYARAASRPESAYRYALFLTPYLRYLEAVGEMDDAEVLEEIAGMREALKSLLCRDGAVLTLYGGAAGIKKGEALALDLLRTLPDQAGTPADLTEILTPFDGNVAIVMDTGVQYNMEYLTMEAAGMEYSAKLDAFFNMASDLVLVPVLRFRYSVYSVLAGADRENLYLMTYRDPMLSQTYRELFPALGEMVLAETEGIGQADLDGYISSAYQELAAPSGPLTRASVAVRDLLTHDNTPDKTLAGMRALKDFAPADVPELAGVLDCLAGDGLKVTVCSPAQLRDSEEMFPQVETYYN